MQTDRREEPRQTPSKHTSYHRSSYCLHSRQLNLRRWNYNLAAACCNHQLTVTIQHVSLCCGLSKKNRPPRIWSVNKKLFLKKWEEWGHLEQEENECLWERQRVMFRSNSMLTPSIQPVTEELPSASCLAMRSCSSRAFFCSSSILLSSAAMGFRWSEQINRWVSVSIHIYHLNGPHAFAKHLIKNSSITHMKHDKLN